jgi:hypothetical protein
MKYTIFNRIIAVVTLSMALINSAISSVTGDDGPTTADPVAVVAIDDNRSLMIPEDLELSDLIDSVLNEQQRIIERSVGSIEEKLDNLATIKTELSEAVERFVKDPHNEVGRADLDKRITESVIQSADAFDSIAVDHRTTQEAFEVLEVQAAKDKAAFEDRLAKWSKNAAALLEKRDRLEGDIINLWNKIKAKGYETPAALPPEVKLHLHNLRLAFEETEMEQVLWSRMVDTAEEANALLERSVTDVREGQYLAAGLASESQSYARRLRTYLGFKKMVIEGNLISSKYSNMIKLRARIGHIRSRVNELDELTHQLIAGITTKQSSTPQPTKNYTETTLTEFLHELTSKAKETSANDKENRINSVAEPDIRSVSAGP